VTSQSTESKRRAPVLTTDNAFYWEGAGRGELLIQACGDCGELCHTPLPLCPVCHSPNRVTKEMSGRGTVASYAIVHHPPNPWVELPAVIVTIDLEEGPQITSSVSDVPFDQLELGMEVEVYFAPTDIDGIGVPLFRPAGKH
jgi:uncharacterized protein